jgi:hypothetical protein
VDARVDDNPSRLATPLTLEPSARSTCCGDNGAAFALPSHDAISGERPVDLRVLRNPLTPPDEPVICQNLVNEWPGVRTETEPTRDVIDKRVEHHVFLPRI